MKRIVGLTVAFVMLLCLFSCGKEDDVNLLLDSKYVKTGYDGKTGFAYCVYEDYSIVTGYEGNEISVTVPTKIESKKVMAVGEGAFKDNSVLETVLMPETVLVIEDSAFENCVNLKKIVFSEKTYSIGTSAFAGDKSLTAVSLPPATRFIGGCAFSECEKLDSISIPKSTENIGGGAFSYTPWLEKQNDEFVFAGKDILIHYNGEDENVVIPSNAKQISAFYNNTTVKSVELPEDAVSIGDYAFTNSPIEGIVFGAKMRKIGRNAFDSCLNLKSVSLDDEIVSIGEYAFASCQLLEEIVLTKNIRTLGEGAFSRCEKLSSVTFNGYSTKIGEKSFESCSELKTVKGIKGAYCEKFATENKISFEEISE